MKKILLLCCLVWLVISAKAQHTASQKILPPFLYEDSHWADSLLGTMSLDEKIGQLFMIACWSRNSDSELVRIPELIRNNHIGGIIFMQGGPVRQAELTNYFQQVSKVPILISQDAEWGLSMRLDSVINFPRQLMMGAANNPELVYAFGKEMARECRRLGVNVSFSPDVDINSNPLNPIIGDRSFGEDKFAVTSLGLAYMRGLQDGGVLACAKHFPGHGNTDKDSHKTLPVVSATRAELDSVELFPFRHLIDAGVGSVMVAHLDVPSLDTTAHLPATLSPPVVTGLLRNELKFHGLVITDALNMKGVTDYYPSGTVEVDALLAGNDVLLFSEDVPVAVQAIKDAIAQHLLSEEDINLRVRKILLVKYWCGLQHFKPIALTHLVDDLNAPEAQFLKEKIIEQGITLLKNKGSLLPLQRLDTFRFASVAINDSGVNDFQKTLSNYAPVKHFFIRKDAPQKVFAAVLDSLKDYNAVFISIRRMNRLARYQYGVTDRAVDFITQAGKGRKVFLAIFGIPYALQYFESAPYLVDAYNNDEMIESLTAQLFFGGIPAQGHLPVTVSSQYFRGKGLNTTALRLRYGLPEELGISTKKLAAIDTLANEAIAQHATPGCQVFVAKDGVVIWNKSYGNYTYDESRPVQQHTLYDVASVTKIAATTLMVMKLWEEHRLDLDKTIGDYLPEFKGTDKSSITLHELLTHQGGLKPYIPFYRHAMDSSGVSAAVFRPAPGGLFTVEVTPHLFMNRHYIDTMWRQIRDSPMSVRGKYVYSDLDFYFLKRIAEKAAGEPLDQYVAEHFYAPLGLGQMCFNPLRFFPKEKTAPSNYDFIFRKDLLQGTVHDQGAAMLGGVGGHAGLFADASDLGTLMQMLMNDGEYGGIRFLDSATVKKFTSQYSAHFRRGLGFDKPEMQPGKASPCAKDCSASTFGHQGFTGTCTWADPENHLVYVFLSNRTFPDDENNKLTELSTRTRIQEVIYKAIGK